MVNIRNCEDKSFVYFLNINGFYYILRLKENFTYELKVYNSDAKKKEGLDSRLT